MPCLRPLSPPCLVSLTPGRRLEIRLLPVGRFAATDGSGWPEGIAGWMLDEAAAVSLMAQASLRASDFVIDFEHQTLHKEANGQPAPAAGWFKALQFRPVMASMPPTCAGRRAPRP